MKDILKFLISAGGTDTTRFVDDEGKPDVEAAAACARKLQAKIGDSNLVKVSHRVNAVRMSIVDQDIRKLEAQF